MEAVRGSSGQLSIYEGKKNGNAKYCAKIAIWSGSFAALILLSGALLYLSHKYFNAKIIPYALPAALIIIPALFILTIYKMDRYISKNSETVKNLV